MHIKHFYDHALAQGSFAIESNGKVALVDPSRDIQPYIDFAKQHDADIIAVFETHPHADFISSHLEIQEKFGAKIYVNEKVGVSYDFKHIGHGDEVKVGKVTFRALFTPGHSPDHNSYLLLDENGNEKAVFTGDSLFVGDVGRPDLREGAGNIQVSRKELAGMMYDTVNGVFSELADDTIVYPAHGPGSLCGKNMSNDLSSTISNEKANNWAFQIQEKDKFVNAFLEGQSFIPKYFPNSVEVNRKGAKYLEDAVKNADKKEGIEIPQGSIIIDTRDKHEFKKGHLKGAINIQNKEADKFETWLGSIVGPSEKYYLVAENQQDLEFAIYRVAKIGYESNLVAGVINPKGEIVTDPLINIDDFKNNPDAYTIIDIRNESEVADGKFFDSAKNIPLPELRERAAEVDIQKPVVVHCAGGYRSSAGFSIIKSLLPNAKVYDLSDAVDDFK
ncbi:MBL fold metallo-hydrolase [Marivirga tractuosa]|uniref:Rhodanese domain protein n=1 Tax=Marivirga tractuosa (strain ATCC 23168 / DSM 4126 / NBRC 15989 / NCIMB 1408 / VKM B-1430 / H-43) TaxID=643867 RepID=E4TVN2_MARTH|nr:rhodanese-like domain-containing protein [Marivirga tractuosa]ADR21145.1 Rhodanese domain protein [Marivirga tractuosa DSM 4126]BDD14401.1 MBL fold metallo-hydrolase [Marivirga tractuosa]